MRALAVLVVLAAGVVPGLTARAAGATSDEVLSVVYRNGLLTVHCENTSLGEVFRQVAATTGISFQLEQSATSCRRTRIEHQPLEWALDRFLTDHGFSYVLILAPDAGIVGVRAFQSGGRTPPRPTPPRPARAAPRPVRRWPWIR